MEIPSNHISEGRSGSGPDVVLRITEWLSGDECRDLTDNGLIAGLGQRLLDQGLPLDRLTLHLPTLHPMIFARTVAWAPNEPVEILDRRHGAELSAAFAGSPLRQVMATGQPMLVRSSEALSGTWLDLDVFRERALREFMIVPLCRSAGPAGAAAFATTRLDGFSTAHRIVIERIAPALRTNCELRNLRRIEATLLDTYIGAATAQHILAGQIRPGEVETLEAALLLCDLRDFTSLSNRFPGDQVLKLLNDYFDCVVPAITDAGGEILKFMGDAVLAFFHGPAPSASCAAALGAAQQALDRLHRLTTADAELRAGVALHYGAVSYGNIGSGARLDFTLIGPDVNLVSRIETACARTGEELLVSSRFAGLLDRSGTRSVGQYELKGFDAPVELFTLRPSRRTPPHHREKVTPCGSL
jgi:adenylate cyclase